MINNNLEYRLIHAKTKIGMLKNKHLLNRFVELENKSRCGMDIQNELYILEQNILDNEAEKNWMGIDWTDLLAKLDDLKLLKKD